MATQVRPTKFRSLPNEYKSKSELSNVNKFVPAVVRVGVMCTEVVVLIADQQESCDLAFKPFAGVNACQRIEVDISLV